MKLQQYNQISLYLGLIQKLSKMFSWFNPTPEEIEKGKAVKDMFYYANVHTKVNIYGYQVRDHNARIYELIEKYKFDLNSLQCRDDYDNSLLHIATKSSNAELTKQLILLGINKHHQNSFGEKPIDIALKNNDLKIIKILENFDCDEYLQSRIDNLEFTNVKLNEDVIRLTNKNITLSDDLSSAKLNLKRQRDDCDGHVKTIKKLKKDNTDLKNTVDSLRDSFKK